MSLWPDTLTLLPHAYLSFPKIYINNKNKNTIKWKKWQRRACRNKQYQTFEVIKGKVKKISQKNRREGQGEKDSSTETLIDPQGRCQRASGERAEPQREQKDPWKSPEAVHLQIWRSPVNQDKWEKICIKAYCPDASKYRCEGVWEILKSALRQRIQSLPDIGLVSSNWGPMQDTKQYFTSLWDKDFLLNKLKYWG